MADKHCGICGATTEPLQPETGGVLSGFMECVDDAACLIRAAQVDEPEAALATPVDPEERVMADDWPKAFRCQYADCDAAFVANTPERAEQRMRHHLGNHAATSGDPNHPLAGFLPAPVDPEEEP